MGLEHEERVENSVNVATVCNTRRVAGAIAGIIRENVGLKKYGRLDRNIYETFAHLQVATVRSNGVDATINAIDAISTARDFIESNEYTIGYESYFPDPDRPTAMEFKIFLHRWENPEEQRYLHQPIR